MRFVRRFVRSFHNRSSIYQKRFQPHWPAKMSQAQSTIRYEIKLVNAPNDPNLRSPTVQSQLENIPRDAKLLFINHDVPTDEEWTEMGSHFTSVKDLELEAGWNESYNDRLMPLHWPLERLKIGSSIAEVIQTPHILLGKVKHLIFYLTSGLRFEGPTSSELLQTHEESVQKGEKQDYYTDNGIKITSTPELVCEWMAKKYSQEAFRGPSQQVTVNPDLQIDAGAIVETEDPKPGTFSLTVLELLDNDAIEMFMRLAIALPHLSYNLRSLKIHSANLCDLQNMGESMFAPLLQCLDQLERLELTLGEVFDSGDTNANTLGTLYKYLPPNIRELRFRGPVSLTTNTEWNEWVTAFGDTAFLPQLDVLSFVCDLAYEATPNSWSGKTKRSATEDELVAARVQCNRLTDAASNRQSDKAVQIEPFVEKWAGEHACFTTVDERW